MAGSRLVRKGVALHNAGRYAEALVQFQQAYREHPELTRLLPLIGACYFNLGAIQEALDHFERYEDLDQGEDLARLRVYYAEVASQVSNLLKGPGQAERGDLHLLLSRALIGATIGDEQRLGAAEASLGRARSLLGKAEQTEAAYGRLLRKLETEHKKQPKKPAILLLLSRVYKAVGRIKDAEQTEQLYNELVPPEPKPVALAPAPAKAEEPLPLVAPKPPPDPVVRTNRPLWRLLAGGGLGAVGLTLAGFGISGLAVDGQCISEADGCSYEYDTRNAGIGLLTSGLLVTAAGVVLFSLPGPRKPRPSK